MRSLNAFVFNFAMPTLIIGAVSRVDVAQLLNWRLGTSWLIAELIIFAAGALLARFILGQTIAARNWAIAGKAAAVGNIGFMLKGVALNPFILSIFAGLALALSEIGLPEALDRLSLFLGATAALFALGAYWQTARHGMACLW